MDKKQELQIYSNNVKTIKHLLIGAAQDFCAVGYYLKQIRDTKQYEQAGFSSIWEMAQTEFGFHKSTASRHMKMNDLYSVDGYSAELNAKYTKFSKSQLQEMMYLPEEKLQEIVPDMRVTEIRELKTETVAMSQQKKCSYNEESICRIEEVKKKYFMKKGDIVGCAGCCSLCLSNSTCEHACGRVKVKEKVTEESQISACITGNNPYGICSSCHYKGAKCCSECISGDSCNISCGWLKEPENHDAQEPEPSTVIDVEPEEIKHCVNPIPVIEDKYYDEVRQYPNSLSPDEIGILEGQVKELKSWLEVMYGAKDLLEYHAYETKLILMQACELMLQHGKPPSDSYDSAIQPELPVLKNMDIRENFLVKYDLWPIWCKNELTEETFYRFNLPDGSAIVVRHYPLYLDWQKKDYAGKQMYLLNPGYKHFKDCEVSMTELKEYLKEVQKK